MAARRRGGKRTAKKTTSKSSTKMLKAILKKVNRIDHHVNPKGFRRRKAKRAAHKQALIMAEGGL